MRNSIFPAADPQDTASVRAALESLRAHLRTVADRYEKAAGNMQPKLAGSLTVVGVPGGELLAGDFALCLRQLAARLREAAHGETVFALDGLQLVKNAHDEHAREESKNG
jgi:class 3 adenylate cyclase